MYFPTVSRPDARRPEREYPLNPGDHSSPQPPNSSDAIHTSAQVCSPGSDAHQYAQRYGQQYGPEYVRQLEEYYTKYYGQGSGQYSRQYPVQYPGHHTAPYPGQPSTERSGYPLEPSRTSDAPPWAIRDTHPSDCGPLAEAMKQDDHERLKYFFPTPRSIDGYIASRARSSPNNHYFTATEADKPVGLVDITRPSSSEDGYIAYWFMKNTKRRPGLATDAVGEAVTRVFKKDPGLQRIFCAVHKKNDASNRLITRAKIAFKPTTRAERASRTAPIHIDPAIDNLYVMPRTEWEARP